MHNCTKRYRAQGALLHACEQASRCAFGLAAQFGYGDAFPQPADAQAAYHLSLIHIWLMLLTAAMTSAALGFPFEPVTSYRVMLACLPLLVVYPMAVGAASRLLAQKTLEQKRMFQKISRFDAATGLMNRQQLQYAATVELSRFVRTGRPAAVSYTHLDVYKRQGGGAASCVASLLFPPNPAFP